MKIAILNSVMTSLIILAGAPSYALSTNKQIDFEFKVRMEAHILRNTLVARHLLTSPEFLMRHPEYRGLNVEKVVTAFLEHDATKLNTSPDYTRPLGLPSKKKSVSHQLAKKFGVNFEKAPEHIKARHDEIIYKLNSGDKKHMKNVLKDLGFTPKETDLFYSLEEAIDKSDRYLSNRGTISPEFNKKMTPATLFIATDKKDARPASHPGKVRAIQIAEFLEDEKLFDFKKTTAGFDDESFRLRRQFSDHNFAYYKHEQVKTTKVALATRSSAVPSVVTDTNNPHYRRSHSAGAINNEKRITKLLKKLPLAGSALSALAIIGSETVAADIIQDLSMSSDLGSGQLSHEYVEDENLFSSYFTLPLNEKERLRRQEPALDKKVRNLLPSVSSLQCNQQDNEIRVRMKFRTKEDVDHIIRLGSHHEVVNVQLSPVGKGEVESQVFYNGPAPTDVFVYDKKFVNGKKAMTPEEFRDWQPRYSRLLPSRHAIIKTRIENFIFGFSTIKNDILLCCELASCQEDLKRLNNDQHHGSGHGDAPPQKSNSAK